jgi:hypothetical protein
MYGVSRVSERLHFIEHPERGVVGRKPPAEKRNKRKAERSQMQSSCRLYIFSIFPARIA